jgi:phage terminase large subunit-like protein
MARLMMGLGCVLSCVTAFTVPQAVSRRQAMGLGAAAGAFIATNPLVASASMDPNDMSRFKKALDGVNYLLDNWDTATVECESKGNGECTDSPDKVRYYFGLRTTDHPLFQLDKLYTKAQAKLPDDVDFEVWIEATENLASQIAKINELAYTSSFGEYNPGGGKEQVRKYLLLCKEQVEKSKDSLETIVKLLKL